MSKGILQIDEWIKAIEFLKSKKQYSDIKYRTKCYQDLIANDNASRVEFFWTHFSFYFKFQSKIGLPCIVCNFKKKRSAPDQYKQKWIETTTSPKRKRKKANVHKAKQRTAYDRDRDSEFIEVMRCMFVWACLSVLHAAEILTSCLLRSSVHV